MKANADEATEPLFPVETSDVTEPKARPKLPGKPRWTRYKAVNPVRCDDCMRVLYDTLGHPAPAARQAKYRRVTHAGDRYLCVDHGRQWREDDGLADFTEAGS